MPLLRFGLFDFDTETRVLRRQGQAVKLQAQPAQVLSLLVERAGEVVTREELRQTVWGNEIFVDFDRGLNFCVAQIRSALGDSADSPRYIKTLPKRGYQFLAPVAREGAADSAPPPVTVPPVRSRRVAIRRILAPAVLMLLGVVFVLVYRDRFMKPPAFTLAVLRFDNETGDPQMDRFTDAVTDSVVAEFTTLGGTRYSVIGNAAILRVPREKRDLAAIGATLGAQFVVMGQVLRSGQHVQVLAHLIHLPDQKHLTVTRVDRVTSDPVHDAEAIAQRIAHDFNNRLGPLPSPGTN